MSVYPDVITGIPAVIPFNHTSSRSVLTTEFENGIEQRRLLGSSTRRIVKIGYPFLTFENANILRRFYEARRGSFEQFLFFYPQKEDYEDEFVGVITSGTTVFDLPSLEAQTYILSRNGVPLTESVDWTFSVGTPPDIPDYATLSITTELGDVFTYDFTGGRLKINARFGDSQLELTEIKKYYASTKIILKGLEHRIP